MVTARQIVRSYNTIARASDRDRKRRVKEAAKEFKDEQKRLEQVNALDAVRRYDEYINFLVSIHKYTSEKLDWNAINDEPSPPMAKKSDTNERQAQEKLNTFSPSFLDKLFGYKKKIKRLEHDLVLARNKDGKEFNEAEENYYDWVRLSKISRGVLFKDADFYRQAIEYFDPFSDIAEIGSKIEFSCYPDFVEIDLYVNNDQVIPGYVLSLTKTGKLSQKEMAKGKIQELAQDHVCSGLLRVGREILAILPIQRVIIHSISKVLISSTGHQEELPIVSVIFTSEGMSNLNFDTIDPSDSLKNFKHNMKFSKVNGFTPIEKVTLN